MAFRSSLRAIALQKIIVAVFYTLVAILGVAMAFYPTLISGFASTQIDAGDSRLNNYFLEHSFQVIFNRTYIGSLWEPAFFYPLKEVLAMSDNLWGSAPIYWVFRGFFSPDISFQLWMIAATLLCFVSFSAILRHFKVGHVLSAGGGFLFAFGMPRMTQLGHQQLLPQFYTPFAFLAVWRFMAQPNNTRFALALLMIYLQLLSGIYLGWFLLAGVIFLIPASVFVKHTSFQNLKNYFQSNKIAAASIVGIWFGATLWLLLPYLRMGERLDGGHSIGAVSTTVARLSSWMLPPPNSLWSPLLEFQARAYSMPNEHRLFMGFTVLSLTVATIYAVFKRREIYDIERERLVKACLLVSTTLFLIFLREIDIWKLVYWFAPGGKAIRVTARIFSLIYFFSLTAIFVTVDLYLKRSIKNVRVRTFLAAALCSLAMVEQILIEPTSYIKAPFLQAEQEIAALMRQDCDLAYVEMGKHQPDWAQQLSAMWAGLYAGVPVINGYSSQPPPRYPIKSMSSAQVRQWLRADFKGKLCMIKPTKPTDSQPVHYYQAALLQPISQKVFAQEIRLLNNPTVAAIDSDVKVLLNIKNSSNFDWLRGDYLPVGLGYRWLDTQGKIVAFDYPTPFLALPTESVAPEESIVLTTSIGTPGQPGQYRLVLSMVESARVKSTKAPVSEIHKTDIWFVDRGAPAAQITIQINDYLALH
jgi:hypothetical protein